MATPIKFGTEFLINTTTVGNQSFPSMTALPNGRFVMTWIDYSQSVGDTSLGVVRAQIFNADGSRFGAEFLGGAPITTLADGRFVVTLAESGQSSGNTPFSAVHGQMFNADGSKSGGEFLVTSTTEGYQSVSGIASLGDGRFVVSWDDEGLSGFVIRAQVFNADGTKSGAEILVNTTRAGYPSGSDITALAGDRFVVTWRDRSESGGDTSGDALRAQVFNANGSKFGTEFLVNTTTANNQREATVTALADGRFAVAWTDDSAGSGDTSLGAIRAQVFNANGSKAGVEILVNTTTADNQGLPAITALADGRFVVAWTDFSVGTDDRYPGAIRAQVLNADGTKSGAEFLVNTTTFSSQFSPTLTTLADDRIVVAWTDFSRVTGDNSFDARGQIFDPRIAAVTLTGTRADDAFHGTMFGDSMAGSLGLDSLFGAGGADRLIGGGGNDALQGGRGNDRLIGGSGKDIMTGGSNADVFVFTKAAESAVGASRDQITDFKAGIDRLDFASFMAGGSFIGKADFTAGNGPQVRYQAGILSGDVNGDGITDFQLKLLGTPNLTAADILF